LFPHTLSEPPTNCCADISSHFGTVGKTHTRSNASTNDCVAHGNAHNSVAHRSAHCAA
jgi:hypothetical protein